MNAEEADPAVDPEEAADTVPEGEATPDATTEAATENDAPDDTGDGFLDSWL